MTFKVIQGQDQGEEMTSVPYWDYFYKPDALPSTQSQQHQSTEGIMH